jgi:predicted ATPase/DNA-binding winged helix-turn-helix (wHTH) protein
MVMPTTHAGTSPAITQPGGVIVFGAFRLVPAARTLTRNGSPVQLGGRALDILIALIERAGQLVSKAELFAAVWPKIFVEESNLRVQLSALRKALGDDRSGTRFIVSIPGRGYMFVADGDVASPLLTLAVSNDHVPAPLVRLIGRDEIVSEIAEQLARDRFVTITGPGGIGKTSVALAIAQKLANTYPDGVQVVDLGSLASPALVEAHLASLLRLPAPNTQQLQYVIAHLRTRNMLIVFDNCEHVIEPLGGIVEAILKGAPEVHILATSREPLRAAGEWVQRLSPLAVPPLSAQLTAAEAMQYAAVQLFAERVLACDESGKVTDANSSVVAELCARLDGLPLAIELAAARVPLFGLRGLADRLDDRFRILTKGRRTALPRHQTLGAMIDWSYETLSDKEKIVWSRLGVFQGAFTIEAAEALGNDRSTEDIDVIDILDSLVEKSLVSVEPRGAETQYRLLESLRLYALEQLLEGKEAESIRHRHAQYYYERSVASGENWIETPTAEWLTMHSGDIADIRAALEWAFAAGGDPLLGIRLTAASAAIWFRMLLLPELRQYLEHAIELAPTFTELDETLVIRLHVALANSIFHTLGPVREAHEALGSAVAIAERRGAGKSQIKSIGERIGQPRAHGDYAALMPWLEGVRSVLVKSPKLSLGPAYDRMAALAYHLGGKQETALRHAEQAVQGVDVVRRTGHDRAFFYPHKIASNAFYSRTLWMSGRADKAAEVIGNTINDDFTADQAFALGFFLVFAALPVAFWSGDLQAAHRHLSTLPQSGFTFGYWQLDWALFARVLDFLKETVDGHSDGRDKLFNDTSLTPFQADSLSTFDWRVLCPQSFAEATNGATNWCTAEVLRAKGEALLHDAEANARPAAETLFLRSLEISRGQRALSWELRSASSLARLWHLGGQTTKARDLLADVYGRFTEGFATRDLMEAKRLLDTLR